MKLASSFLMKVLCKFFKNSFSRFIVSGLCTTFVDFVIYMILSTFITISIAKIISMLSASALSFFLNKKFTFNDKQKTGAILLVRFYVVFALNVFANVCFKDLEELYMDRNKIDSIQVLERAPFINIKRWKISFSIS